MSTKKIVGYSLLGLLVLIALGWVFGMNRVLYTKIIGKEQQNADREVFEETQSYVEGKRQEAAKYYREYMKSEDESDKAVIREVIANSFANFDETKLEQPLQTFVYNCKYGSGY